MARTFFGSGFFPSVTPPPAAYLALVEIFGGDSDAADAWLAAWIAYVGDGATAEQLLAALQAFGPPSAAIDAIGAAPITQASTFVPELSTPLYGVPDTIVPAGSTAALAINQAPTFS